jgi:hypothetical protein
VTYDIWVIRRDLSRFALHPGHVGGVKKTSHMSTLKTESVTEA